MHPRRPPHSILWAMRNVTGAEVYRQESVSRRPLRRLHNLIGHRLLDGDLDGFLLYHTNRGAAELVVLSKCMARPVCKGLMRGKLISLLH